MSLTPSAQPAREAAAAAKPAARGPAERSNEELMLAAARALSAARPESVLADLAAAVAELLEVDACLVGINTTEAGVEMVDVAALYMDGKRFPPSRYPLHGTPCATVIGQAFEFYPSGVAGLFLDSKLGDMQIDGYAGYPMFDAEGAPLGLVAVMSRQPLSHPARMESILRIFSSRAATEIERQRAEQALRRSEARYRCIFNASLDGLAMLTTDGRLVDANPAMEAMYGYTREEVTGRRLIGFFPEAEQREAARRFIQQVLASGYAQTEDRAYRKDGSRFYVEPRGVLIDYEGEPHILVIARDVTERKRAEQERAGLEAQLRQAQKLEALGHLTGGVAHDFNNILTSVLGYVAMARERAASAGDERQQGFLERAERSGERARELIQQMLTFTRGQRGQRRPVDLAQVVEESLGLLRATLPAGIAIETDFAPGLPHVMADPVHLHQIVMNLCINARDALGHDGSIDVQLRRSEEAGAQCSSCRQPATAPCLELAVADSGPGIEPALFERVFEPFFTTKAAGKGSGMGLSVVHGIVHEYGGHILVDSAPGAGTRIRVLLPASLATEAAGEHAAESGPAAASTALAGRVLLCEDNADVAAFMADLLRGWQLEVEVFDEPAAALARCLEGPAPDLVLLDQSMPEMTGLQLATTLLAERPDQAIVLYTGYSERLSEETVRAAGLRALLRKPLDIPALRALLESLLSR